MRLSEDRIKQAILHPELPARTLALYYFSRSFCDDATVMPLVVEAVEKFGREASIHLIGEGENLPQTESTIQWCLDELRQNFGEQDVNLDDYRFALSKVLASADPSLTLTKESEILELPFFRSELAAAFSERIHLLNEDAESVWNDLLDFCERENGKEYLSEMDLPHAYRLVEALGRSGAGIADRALSMLNEEIDYSVNSPRALMQGFVLRLAGELRLKAAIPSLIQLLQDDDDWFNEECQRALTRIGGDEVVEAVSKDFPTAEWYFRLFASGVLEQVHTELAAQKCIELFEQEKDETVKSSLGQAALSQFATEAIEPVRQFILANQLDPEILDMRETLVAASTVLGIDFPGYEQWRQDEKKSRALRRQLLAEKYGGLQEPSADCLDDSEDDSYGSEHDELVEPIPAPTTILRQDARIGRNAPCPCGSGKKYKKCCMKKSNENPILN